MKTIPTLLATLGAAAAMTLAGAAHADTPLVSGEVTKIDKAGGRVTLKHGEIRHLDMPPMTMVWRARPPSLLDNVAVGDRVRFAAAKVDGSYTVTAISKQN